MYPSFSLMLGFEKEVKIKFDAAKIINSDISWISIDSRKPFRNNCFALIAQSSAEYAVQNIRGDKTHVMEYLIQETSDVLSQDLKVLYIRIFMVGYMQMQLIREKMLSFLI
ncbi:MAG: hypothetical protein CM15mP58_13840 [Burkholderiaceae bacterium]|nr:MAG: hypothetical protein CM15mP58_13840 [Burkholderiaceae bacterium]